MKKIAILYFLTGVGPYREARAIGEGLKRRGVETELINMSLLLRDIDPKGEAMVKMAKKVVGGGSKVMANWASLGSGKWDSEVIAIVSKITKMAGKTGAWILGDKLSLTAYDYVISTHPIATVMVKGLVDQKKLLNVCADEVGRGAGQFYYVPDVTTTVNSDEVKEVMKSCGAKERELIVSGHPMDENLLGLREKIHRRVEKDLDNKPLTIGLYVGLLGPNSQKKAILDTAWSLSDWVKGGKARILALTGGHRDLEQGLLEIQRKVGKKNMEVSISNSAEEIVTVGHEWLANEIDVLFSRPSELSCYSLGLGIPQVLFPCCGCQELDMRTLLRKFAPVADHRSIRDMLVQYLENREELKQISNKLFMADYDLGGVAKIIGYLNLPKLYHLEVRNRL